MTTAATLAGDALGLLGVSDPTDAVAAEDATLALRVVNRIVDTSASEALMPVAVAYQSAPLTSGDADITIGLAGDLVISKPTKIETGAYVRSSGIDYPLRRVMRDEWAAIWDKSVTGIPQVFRYEPTTAVLGTLTFWPVPDSDYTAYLPLKSRLSAFADLTTDYDLPEGWDEYLTTALAIHLAPMYQREAPGSVIARMRAAKKLIKRLNVEIPQLALDSFLTGQAYSSGLGGGGGGDFLLVE